MVHDFNSTILNSLLAIFHAINSLDINDDDPDIAHFPAEYLQSLDIGGLSYLHHV